MQQTALTIKTRDASLEGVLSFPSEAATPVPGVVLGHSHPVLGGTMDEPVMTELVMALNRAGMATLRFNFHGISYIQDEPPKENIGLDDMRSAAKLLKGWRGIDSKRLAMVGYSFGAQVVIQGIRHFKEARAMVLISPPLPSLKDAGSAVGMDRRPRLFLAGDKDRLTSVKALQARVAAFPQQADFVVVPDADHSWRGRETELARRVTDFLMQVL
jgi:alpha/beta superfamily hydrolase